MINSELLKEAIADAKAVRATALANAKAALEEAFAPRFEAMFADKLKEESEEQEEGLQEVEAPNQVDAAGGEARGPKTKAVSKGNPKQPNDSSQQFVAVKAGKGPSDVPNPSLKGIKEVAEEEEESVEEGFEQEEEQVSEAGLTSEDLDEIIKELEGEVADEEEGQPVAPAPVAGGEEGGEEGFPPAPQAQGEPDGDEMGAGIEAEPGSEVNIDLGAGEGDGEEVGLPPQGMNASGMEQPPMGDVGQGMPQGIPGQQPPAQDDDENINLEELLAALNEESEEEQEESVDESAKNGYSKGDAQNKAGGVKGYPSAPQDASKKQLKGKNHNISGQGNIGTGAVGGLSESAQYKVALKEAYKTIEFLRGQINEVNLLNAKLLYTNKLFKEFAGVLDDPYRMKIVESFDLTKSVREVKLAYALLAESLNFGTHMMKVPAKQIVKAISNRTQIKQITEGFASKPVSSTKPSQLITEGNEMALRFKKLAGIKEAPKVISERK